MITTTAPSYFVPSLYTLHHSITSRFCLRVHLPAQGAKIASCVTKALSREGSAFNNREVSRAVLRAFDDARLAATLDMEVLMSGEGGTGGTGAHSEYAETKATESTARRWDAFCWLT